MPVTGAKGREGASWDDYTLPEPFVCVQQVVYSSSVDIRPEWVVKDQIPFTSLVKLNYQVGEPTDLAFCGQLEYYDKAYDRVTPRTEKPLKRSRRSFRSVTTSDDPVIR